MNEASKLTTTDVATNEPGLLAVGGVKNLPQAFLYICLIAWKMGFNKGNTTRIMTPISVIRVSLPEGFTEGCKNKPVGN